MIHVLAIITAKPGKRDEVLAAFRANMPAVHAEQGCIEYGPATDAEGLRRAMHCGENTGSLVEYLQSRDIKPNPMNLYGEPEDVAKLVRYLVTDQSRLMTGETIRIDRGELL